MHFGSSDCQTVFLLSHLFLFSSPLYILTACVFSNIYFFPSCLLFFLLTSLPSPENFFYYPFLSCYLFCFPIQCVFAFSSLLAGLCRELQVVWSRSRKGPKRLAEAKAKVSAPTPGSGSRLDQGILYALIFIFHESIILMKY